MDNDKEAVVAGVNTMLQIATKLLNQQEGGKRRDVATEG
jgi:hypothetical protein